MYTTAHISTLKYKELVFSYNFTKITCTYCGFFTKNVFQYPNLLKIV